MDWTFIRINVTLQRPISNLKGSLSLWPREIQIADPLFQLTFPLVPRPGVVEIHFWRNRLNRLQVADKIWRSRSKNNGSTGSLAEHEMTAGGSTGDTCDRAFGGPLHCLKRLRATAAQWPININDEVIATTGPVLVLSPRHFWLWSERGWSSSRSDPESVVYWSVELKYYFDI